MKLTTTFLVLFLLAFLPCFSSDEPGTLTANAVNPNRYELIVSDLPALTDNGAAYDFLWLFGDGQFAMTTTNSITHTFVRPAQNPINQATVTVYVSSRYSDSDLPPVAMSKVVTLGGGVNNSMDAEKTEIGIRTNHPLIQSLDEAAHSIVPGDVNVCILSYSHAGTAEHELDGRLFFFYNEEDKPINEMLLDQHTAFQEEKLIPVMSNMFSYKGAHKDSLDSAFERYTGAGYVNVKKLAPGEERHLALAFKISDEIPPSWGDIFNYRVMFIPDNPEGPMDPNCEKIFRMAHVNVHDPNYLHVSKRQVRWRTEGQELVYTLYFENEGNDNAKKVLVQMPVPPSLHPHSLHKISEFPSGCWKYTGDEDKLEWVVESSDVPIDDGYIQFSLKTGGIRKKNITGQAKIMIWGMNALNVGDSLYTNTANTSVLDHWRWGVRMGMLLNQYSGMDGFDAGDWNTYAFQYTSVGLTLVPHDPFSTFRYHEISLSTPVFRTNPLTNDYSTVLRFDLFPYKIGYRIPDSKLFIGAGAVFSLNMYAWDLQSGQERYSIFNGQNRNYQCWGGGLSGEASFPFIVEDLRLEFRYQLMYNTLVAGRSDHWYYTVGTGLHYTFSR